MNNVYKTQGVDKKSIGFKRRYKDVKENPSELVKYYLVRDREIRKRNGLKKNLVKLKTAA